MKFIDMCKVAVNASFSCHLFRLCPRYCLNGHNVLDSSLLEKMNVTIWLRKYLMC